MMDQSLSRFEQVVRSVRLSLPRIPIVSTVTGKWMNDADAINPSYWAAHLRSTVRFSDAVKTILEEDNKILLEAGPRNVYYYAGSSAGGKKICCHHRQPRHVGKCIRILFADESAGQLWLNGIQLDWKAFYEGQERSKLSLPSYTF